MPPHSPGLKAVLSYYQSAVKVNAEGDVHLSDETIQGLGTTPSFLITYLFGAIAQIVSPPKHQQNMMAYQTAVSPDIVQQLYEEEPRGIRSSARADEEKPYTIQKLQIRSVLIEFVPDPGYFLAGGLAGVASRTTTAPLDRLKVYLIAQTGAASEAVHAAKKGAPLQATKQGANTLISACRDLWAAGGIRSLFAGVLERCSLVGQ